MIAQNVKTFLIPFFKLFEKCSTSRFLSVSKRGKVCYLLSSKQVKTMLDGKIYLWLYQRVIYLGQEVG